MATVPGQLLWEIVKTYNCFLVKPFGRGNAKVQFSKECNNFRNLNSYNHSDWFQEGHVTVRWDIMNESSDNYSANITILNYLKNHDIERPWELRWAWPEDEILLSTVGVKGKQHVAVKEKKHGNNSAGGYTINYVKIEPNRCKGCVIPSWFREADLAKSSSSFQINVGRAGIGYNEPRGFGIRYFELPRFVKFTSPRANYICESLFFSSKTRGYMKTWSMRCGRRDKPEKKFNKILNNDD
ncbi:COBRA-like protein 2 isoform X2 [Eutrema salsugineum]|uniref:COBRA-like protein 2 isoform X2 n=1 Tax=Eutrema salsugineum TaxID=72664 RepID=UPI000CED042B|nr:COBRA-like protein 2 isoform X2 [Eutrema salsugineum]XP_024008782.1 COBRA-like protein 2 isoform X2 [Eutrema salsugineum]